MTMSVLVRPRRCTSKPDYHTLANGVTVPRSYSSRSISVKLRDKKKGETSQLYRLTIVEVDETNEMVKVHYIGYGSEQDEWRSRSDIVHINGASEESESSCYEQDSHADDETTLAHTYTKCIKYFCLYDELRSRIKSL